MNRMRVHLFYTFLGVYAATAVVTLLALVNLVQVREGFFVPLFGTFLVETVVAVIALFQRTDFLGEKEDFETLPAPSPAPVPEVPALEKPPEEKTQGPRRPDIEERILAHIAAVRVCKVADIVKKFGISHSVAMHHVEALERTELLSYMAEQPNFETPIQLTTNGRKYLVTYGLIL
jgi:DNA-binding transcriptional ArsR family regulator